MSQTISFGEIPASWYVPGAYSEVRPIRSGQAPTPFRSRALIMAPALSYLGGSGPVNIYDPLQADGVFGVGSIAALMARAFLLANPYTPLDVIAAIDPNGTTQAAGKITFAGASLITGTTAVTINGVRIPFTVNSTDTPTIIAANAAAAINATSQMPVAATAAAAVLTLTAKGGGVLGNDIPLQWAVLAQDQLPGLQAAVTAMAGGASSGTVAAMLATVANTWYTDIISAWNDAASLSALATDLTRRYNVMSKLDAHGYFGFRGTYSASLTASSTLNCQFMTGICAQNAGSAPWIWAASLGGVASLSLANDPARQLRTLPLPGVVGPLDGDCYIDQQRNILLQSGWSTWKKLTDGTVTLERVVTTYQSTPLGVPDDSWLDIMVPKTMTRIRYDWDAYILETYPRSKLADVGSIAASLADDTITTDTLAASWAARCKLYESNGWIENSATTSKMAQFVRDQSSRNKVDAALPLQIIGNLMDLMSSIQFEV